MTDIGSINKRLLMDMTGEERFILQWLSKEDSSSYGECAGLSLNVLLNRGYAKTSCVPPSDYDRVSLTDKGYELAKSIRPGTSDIAP